MRSSVARMPCSACLGMPVFFRITACLSREMSQVSRTSVRALDVAGPAAPPSAGSSSYRQIRPPTKPPSIVVCHAMRRSGSYSMTVLVVL